MNVRRFGIGLRGNLSPGEYGRLGRLAEDLGFDVVSAFHDLGDQPALVPLVEVAKVTQRVALGPLCRGLRRELRVVFLPHLAGRVSPAGPPHQL